MKMLKLAALLTIGTMLPLRGADQGVENDEWDIVENQQTAVIAEKNATSEKDAQPSQVDILKRRLEAVEAQLKSALEANEHQVDLKRASEKSVVSIKRKVRVRVVYDSSGSNGDNACIVDGEIFVDPEMTLGEIRKLASTARLYHNSGIHHDGCLEQIRAALVEGYRFKHGTGWLGREMGCADDKLSVFKKENQSDVYFTN